MTQLPINQRFYRQFTANQHLPLIGKNVIPQTSRISRSLSFLKYAKKFLPLKTLNFVYKGVVEPHFRYCCSPLGNCGESKNNALQKLQNRAAKTATNSSYDASDSPLLSKL